MSSRRLYLDYAATTPLAKEVVRAMDPYWREHYGNPSSLHSFGQTAKQALSRARHSVASVLNVAPEEIYFTGGGTASINLALKGLIAGLKASPKKLHIISSVTEHPAVLNSLKKLEHYGCQLTLLPVDADGLVSLADLKNAITNNTVLVSLMMANNEIGTIAPISEYGSYLTKLNKDRLKNNLPYIYFHTDACQAAGALELVVPKLHVDMMSLSASKIYGPKGIGLLYARRSTPLVALLDGGGQESDLNSGTENVPAIVGLATALELAEKRRESSNARLRPLRDWLIKELQSNIPDIVLNGHSSQRLPNNVNVSILNTEGEAVVLNLDQAGIAVSTGSACSSTTLEPSHVILALAADPDRARSALRISLGRDTKAQDLKYLMKKLVPIIGHLRSH